MPQFGGAYSQQKEFRRRFIESLQIALAVYPDAKVEVIPGGLRLDKSKPPVLPRS
jgi:hypothetical protein